MNICRKNRIEFDTGFIYNKIKEAFKWGFGVWRAGEVDPSNGTKFWTDCVNLPIADLDPFMQFADSLALAAKNS